DHRQLLLDRHSAPIEARGVERPVTLDSPEFRSRVRNRGDRDLLRVEADIRRSCRRTRWPRGDQQPTMPRVGTAELTVEVVGKSLRGEVGGADAHGISIARRTWRVGAHLPNSRQGYR